MNGATVSWRIQDTDVLWKTKPFTHTKIYARISTFIRDHWCVSPSMLLGEMLTNWNKQSPEHTDGGVISPAALSSRGFAAHVPVTTPSEIAGSLCTKQLMSCRSYSGHDQNRDIPSACPRQIHHRGRVA